MLNKLSCHNSIDCMKTHTHKQKKKEKKRSYKIFVQLILHDDTSIYINIVHIN